MAIYSLHISNSRTNSKNVSAKEHHDYVSREGKYSPTSITNNENEKFQSSFEHLKYIQRKEAFANMEEYEDLVCSVNRNMPTWAKENPNLFWEASEIYERENGRTYTEFLLSLPHEFSNEENKKLVDKFCEDTFGLSFVYSYGIHSKPSSVDNIQNIHAHIMFSERKLDGIERSPEQFFKRYNSKYPERGGAGKDRFWNDKHMFNIVRKSWETFLNKELEEKEIEKVSCESLAIQKLNALSEGDLFKAEFLDRPPVNCSGTILMKINKYGEKTLSLDEKLEYNAFLLSKEIRDIKKRKYELSKEQTKEINFSKSCIDIAEDVLLEKTRYIRTKIRQEQMKNDINNEFEKIKYSMKYSCMANGIITDLYSEEDTKQKLEANTEYRNFFEKNFSEIKYPFEEKIKENEYAYADFSFNEDVYRAYGPAILNIEKRKNDLSKELSEILNQINEQTIDFESQFHLDIVKNMKKTYPELAEFALDLYKEKDRIEKELNRGSFSKLFSRNKKTNEELQEELSTVNRRLGYCYDTSKSNNNFKHPYFLEKLKYYDRNINSIKPKLLEATENMKPLLEKYEKVKFEIDNCNYILQNKKEFFEERDKHIDRNLDTFYKNYVLSTVQKEYGIDDINLFDIPKSNISFDLEKISQDKHNVLVDSLHSEIETELRSLDVYDSLTAVRHYTLTKTIELLDKLKENNTNIFKEKNLITKEEKDAFKKSIESCYIELPKIGEKISFYSKIRLSALEKNSYTSKTDKLDTRKTIVNYLEIYKEKNILKEKVDSITKLLQDEERIEKIALSKNIKVDLVKNKYENILDNLVYEKKNKENEFSNIQLDFSKIKNNYNFSSEVKSLKEEILNIQKSNFAKIDEAKRDGNNTNELFIKSKEIKIKLEKISEILGEEKEILQKEKKIINSSKVKDNTEELISEAPKGNSKKIIDKPNSIMKENNQKEYAENKNKGSFSSAYIPKKRKKKRRGLVDEEDGLVKEVGQGYERD